MSTKTIIVLLVGLTLASVRLAEAQQTGKVFRIGVLDPSDARSSAVRLEAFCAKQFNYSLVVVL